ncbi:hypothetical protein [Archangium sp.]|uniref:hypothetical protein n=1 Tax=Archangium sp. TaxID=1872627 RepID=UPI002D30CCD2|nr:hypothetical protein [Archangium sp.]HYO58384.1 hypothetical protein [Archangium sp.]
MNRQKDALPQPEWGGGSHEPGPATARERWLWRVWEDVRRGAGHFHQRGVALPVNRTGQFVHGLCLPFHLVRALWADPGGRRRYLAVSFLQAAAIIVLAVLFTGSGKEVMETVGPDEWTEQRVEEAQAEEEEAEARMERLRKLEKVAEVAAVIAGSVGADPDEVRAAVARTLREAEVARESRRAAREAADKEAGRPVERTMHRVVYWAALLSSLQVAQWIVIALSRDYHTALSREASLLTGVAPEDEPLTPRVRLNIAWLRGKMKRRWRALVVLAFGVPVLWVLTVPLPWGGELFTVLMFLWGAWWFVVFTAGKSALAWSESAPREPWFLRGWNGLVSRVAPLRWALLGVYGWLWTKSTRDVFAPAASVERRPWGLVGLAVVRALAVLPLVKCFLRPVIPVAAAHLLAAGVDGSGEGSAG